MRRILIGVVLIVSAIVGPMATAAHASPQDCLYGLCPCGDPSKICPPTVPEDIHYAWLGGATGSQWADEFTSFNNNVWFKQGIYPANNDAVDELWDPANVTVGDGELQLKTDYSSADSTQCEAQYHSSSCWISGGVGQCAASAEDLCGTGGNEPWLSSGQVAVDMKITGNNITGLDSTLEAGAYPWTYAGGAGCPQWTSGAPTGCSWPPEIDFLENGSYALSSDEYDSYLHCFAGSDPDASQLGISQDLTKWQVYEVDWTTSEIEIWDNGSSPVATWSKSSSDAACQSDWPPSPVSAMGAFLEAQMFEANSSHSSTQTMLVDWVAERAGS
jgi:hypothetical protein